MSVHQNHTPILCNFQDASLLAVIGPVGAGKVRAHVHVLVNKLSYTCIEDLVYLKDTVICWY